MKAVKIEILRIPLLVATIMITLLGNRVIEKVLVETAVRNLLTLLEIREEFIGVSLVVVILVLTQVAVLM